MAYFAASCDPPERNKAFAESDDIKADYPILSDPDGTVASRYGIYNIERKVPARVTFYIGEDGKILFIDKAVKTGSHGADIAARLKELGVAAKK